MAGESFILMGVSGSGKTLIGSKVAPTTELFPMSKINDAIQHVRDGKARYRVVLKADY